MKSKLKFFVLIALLPFVLTACTGPKKPGGNNKIDTGTTEPVTIEIWRTFDGEEVFDRIINDFELRNQNINLKYRKLSLDEYELVVSEALAAGKGPDIWSIRNDWLPRHKDKLIPMPENLLAQKNNNDQEVLKTEYVPVVGKDVTIDGRIYGLPYYVDTLVIYKNEEVFRKKIDELNKQRRTDDVRFLQSSQFNTYDKLQKAVELLTEKEKGGKILVSGLAAGLASNVSAATDVVYAMMLQNSTEMVSPEKTNASFHLPIKNAVGQEFLPGKEALERFTGFSDSAKPYYSWNNSMPQDIQAFISGKAAMIFGFGYYQLILSQSAPTLKYSTLPLPQVRDTDNPVDYGSYWVETVTKNADDPAVAWQVLKDLVINKVSSYLSATGRPAPSVVLNPPTVVEREKRNNPLNYQTQTATSWYKTKRPDKVDQIFRELIQTVGTKSQPTQNAIEEAAQKVSTQLQKDRES